jgi:hypothetical protein
LAEKTGNTDRPSIGFCILFLIGSKYECSETTVFRKVLIQVKH